ncbi:MAG: hypothetical protein KKE86_14340 [Planctomycetes bacterium]|nr:hypothetical protein [Planctomycetota bacterium]MBU4400499.1 hypothetical protein [Planctomycetota bacterium]MCG2682683.1 hypothetical protein [Planctomycetales bacterium]
MPQPTDRNHFIVKHGLDSLGALPSFIWRTGTASTESPRHFSQVKQGDRWIAFAYTSSDRRERQLSHITGFYECIQTKRYGDIPLPAEKLDEIANGARQAWMIEGKKYGVQPHRPVGVPAIDNLLGKPHYKQATLIRITAEEFEHIRKETLRREFDPRRIPLLLHEPNNEQELLAAVAYGHKKLGIERILRVQTAFPDLLVNIKGYPQEVHLELEVYSQGFFSHGHDKQVSNRRFKGDGKDIAVLCWIDNNRQVKDWVHEVYELQTLIREGAKIVW